MSNSTRAGVNWMRQVSSPKPREQSPGRDIDIGLEPGRLSTTPVLDVEKIGLEREQNRWRAACGGRCRQLARHRNPGDRIQRPDHAPLAAGRNELVLPPGPVRIIDRALATPARHLGNLRAAIEGGPSRLPRIAGSVVLAGERPPPRRATHERTRSPDGHRRARLLHRATLAEHASNKHRAPSTTRAIEGAD